MSSFMEELQRMAEAETVEDRLAVAASIDSSLDDVEAVVSTVPQLSAELDQVKTERDTVSVERDEFKEKFVKAYFTSPNEIKTDQLADAQKDARPEAFGTLFKMREGY